MSTVLKRSVLVASLLCCVTAIANQSPTIIVVMVEQVGGVYGTQGHVNPSQAETTIMQHLTKLGFKVVDSSAVRRNISQSQARLLIEGDSNAAKQLALKHEADYSMVGLAISKPAGSKLLGTQMKTLQATLTARLIRTADAQVLSAVSAQDAKAHIDEVQGGALAIEAAAQELVKKMTPRLEELQQPTADVEAQQISVQMTRLASYSHLTYIVDYLENEAENVAEVRINSFNDGVASLSVTVMESAFALADEVAQHSFEDFLINPVHVTSDSIHFTVQLTQ